MYGRMGGTTMLSVPGVRVIVSYLLSLIGLYPVVYHGVATGLTSANAAANTTALVALAGAAATAGGGVLLFTAGTFPLNATSLDHDLGSSASISLVGVFGATALLFFGAAGPFLDLGDGADHALHRCGLKNLTILHGEAVTSGATVRIGENCTSVELDHVYILDGGNASLINVEVVGGANIRACKLVCKDHASARNVVTSYAGASSVPLYIVDSDLSGGHGNSFGIEFSRSTGLVDGVLILGTYIKDHDIGLKAGLSTGDLANVIVGDSVIDVVDVGVLFEPQTGAAYSTFDISNLWISADEKGYQINEGNGGTVDDIAIHGGRITDVTAAGIEILGGVTDVLIHGVRIHGGGITGASDGGIEIGDGATSPTNVLVNDNIVKVAGTAAGSIVINSNVAVVGVFGNLSRGADVSFGGATSGARCYEAVNNPFAS